MPPTIPIDKIELVPINDLRAAEYNPRRTTVDEANNIKASLVSLGFIDPIIVNRHPGRENIIVGGHQRWYAAKELGMESVPCVFVDYDEAKEREANLRLNRNTGGWDWEALTAFDPTLLREVGFSELELIEHFDLDDKETPQDEFDPDAELGDAGGIVMGDVFQLGDHRLMCGDATDPKQVQTLMGEERAAMVFTDPPYNVDYQGGMNAEGQNRRSGILNDKMSPESFYQFLLASLKNCMAVCDGALYVFMSSSELPTLKRAFEDAGGHYQGVIVWAKQTFTLSRSDYQHQFEPAVYGWRKGVINHYFIGTRKESDVWEPLEGAHVREEDGYTVIKVGERWLKLKGRVEGFLCDKDGQTDIWRENKPSKSTEHPTMKPLRRVSRAVRNSSRPRELVLDLFGGSGSTLMACEGMARRCYTMELDPKYVNVIVKRWESHTGRKAEKCVTGHQQETMSQPSGN